MPKDIEPVETPFPMPQPLRPAFGDRVVRLVGPPSKGAIQQAIDGLAAAGGGRLSVASGDWPTGRLQLKSGVELHLEGGVHPEILWSD